MTTLPRTSTPTAAAAVDHLRARVRANQRRLVVVWAASAAISLIAGFGALWAMVHGHSTLMAALFTVAVAGVVAGGGVAVAVIDAAERRP